MIINPHFSHRRAEHTHFANSVCVCNVIILSRWFKTNLLQSPFSANSPKPARQTLVYAFAPLLRQNIIVSENHDPVVPADRVSTVSGGTAAS